MVHRLEERHDAQMTMENTRLRTHTHIDTRIHELGGKCLPGCLQRIIFAIDDQSSRETMQFSLARHRSTIGGVEVITKIASHASLNRLRIRIHRTHRSHFIFFGNELMLQRW